MAALKEDTLAMEAIEGGLSEWRNCICRSLWMCTYVKSHVDLTGANITDGIGVLQPDFTESWTVWLDEFVDVEALEDAIQGWWHLSDIGIMYLLWTKRVALLWTDSLKR